MYPSCRSVQMRQHTITAEAQRRFNYYYMEAVKHRLAGRYDDAFALFEHCREIHPEAPEALHNLGLFYYLLLEDNERGERYLSRAAELAPDNISYKEALASFYLRKRDKAKALPVLEDIVRCNPARSDVLAQLVNMYMADENYAAAVRALDRIETLEGRNVSASLEKFRLYREMGETEKAFAELEALAADNPNDLSYRVLIGDQYLLVEQPEKALAEYEKVRQREPGNQALQMSMLDYYKQQKEDSLYQIQLESLLYGPNTGDDARALLMRNYVIDCENAHADTAVVLDAFNRVFASTPETVDMLSLYASYLQLKKMDDKLPPVMERILKIEPDNQGAVFQLMQMAIRANDYDKVVEVCARGIAHHPDQLPFYFYQGFAYYQLDALQQALDVLRTGVKQIQADTDPNLVADMFSIMGDLYYKEGQHDSAYAAYDSCLVYKSGHVATLNNYAYYLSLEKRNLDKAEEMSHYTVVAEPSNKTYLDTYAWVLFVKGKYAEAKVYMDRVLEGDPETDEQISAGVLEHAGDIYACCGELETALRYWRMAEAKGGADVSKSLKQKIKQKKYISE